MARNEVPPNSLYSIFEDRDKDPVRVLNELERGLRSDKVGEQCESILFFAELFSRYPFPSIVASAFVKLADLYHGTSDNVIRYCIGRVFEEQARTNTQLLRGEGGSDEATKEMLLQRLLQPLHSSDPCAKALTLRTLGSMSIFLGEDLGLQHSIRNCLSSNHPLEASAAIMAVDGVCQRSASFARSILPYIADLLQGLRSPPLTKLKLIYVLRHMGHDPEMINEARDLLQNVMESLPSQIFTRVSLHTLTLLTTSSLFFVPQQVSLLLKYWQDPRLRIRLLVLRDLRRIVVVGSHHINLSEWPIKSFIFQCERTSHAPVRREYLLLFRSLFRIFGVDVVIPQGEKYRLRFQDSCSAFLREDDARISLPAAQVFALLSQETETEHCVRAICLSIEQKMRMGSMKEEELEAVTLVLIAIVAGKAHAQSFLFCTIISTLLQSTEKAHQLVLSKALGMIVSHAEFPAQLLISSENSKQLTEFILRSPDSSITTALASCLFSGMREASNSERTAFLERMEAILQSLQEQKRGWEQFTIARSAACNGFHTIAQHTFAFLATQRSLPLFYWLKSLASVSQAEGQLSLSGGGLATSLSTLLEALTFLRAARLKNMELNFQEQFLQLRYQFLQSISALMSEIAFLVRHKDSASALSARFVRLSEEYGLLRSSFFDLDQASIALLEENQIMCSLVTYAIESTFRIGEYTPDPILLQLLLGEQKKQSQRIKACSFLFQQLQKGSPDSDPMRVQLILNLVKQLLSIRLEIPRYFFQSKSRSTIQISTTPSSPANGGLPVTAVLGSGLVLKITGLINHASTRNERHLKKALLRVSIRERFSDHQTLQLLSHPEKNAISSLDLVVEPSNDSFVGSTVLSFPKEGKFSVVVQCRLLDRNNVEWIERKNTIIQVLVKPQK